MRRTLGYIRPVNVTTALLCLGLYCPAQTPSVKIPPAFRTAARSMIASRVDRTQTLETPGAVHPEVAAAADLGPVAGSATLEHMQLHLRRPSERQTAFDAEVEALNDPSSPVFHQWLTPEEVGSEFGPSMADLATLTSFLTSEGFTVNRVSKSGLYIDFAGSAAQVQNTFQTSIHNFRLAAGRTHYSAATPARIPAALAPAVAGFVSLSDIPFHPLHHAAPAYSVGCCESVGAQDFYTIYNERPLLTASTPINGSGQTLALIEETDINTADVTYFRNFFGVSPATPTLNVQHGSASVSCSDPGVTDGNNEAEAVLDTEWAGAIAPGATLLYMSCATASTEGIVLSAESVVDDNLAGVISLSYGGSETGNSSFNSFISGLWQQAASQGQTVVVSSGDSGSDGADQGASIGSHGISVNVLASTAYNVSAGGTDFQDAYNQTIDGGSSYGVSAFWNGSNGAGQLTAKSYIPETTWNGTCASSLIDAVQEGINAAPLALCEDANRNGGYLGPNGGGGGTSIFNARPSWQNNTVYGLPATATYPDRLVPDVSFFASNGIWGHAIYLYQSDQSSSPYGAGGTSFVAPQVAGVFALIAQKTGSRLGLANIQLYNLAGQAFGTSSFTGSGCNGSGASGTGETASLPGSSCVFYDVQTGNNSVACTAGTTNCFSDSGQSYGLLSTSSTAAVPAYTTGQGYDMATGIGSLNITNLVNGWATSTLTPSTTSLTISRQSFPLNTSVFFTGSVASTTGVGTPTGTIQLYMGSTPVYLASAALSNGTTSSRTRNFPAGSYTVFAKYAGDGTFGPSNSATVALTVAQQTTTTSLAAPSPSSGNVYATTVALSATLSPTTAGIFSAGGTLAFLDGTTTVCSGVAFSGGTATCTSPALSVGMHSFTAAYTGDSNFAASVSSARTLTVAKATPSVTVSSQSAPYGTPSLTLSASIAYGTGSLPSGAVTFTVDSGSAAVATCTGSSSPLACSVTYSTAALGAGSHTITVSLTGDGNYSAASGTSTLTISAIAPVIVFSVPNHTYGDAPFVISATSTSSAAFTYSVVSGPASVAGATVTLNGIGVVILQASQAAAGNYTAATQNAASTVSAGSSIWLGNQNSSLSTFSLTGTPLSPSAGFTGGALGVIPSPLGMAFDHSASLWILNASGGVSQFTRSGSPVTSSAFIGGGINAPLAIAIDGASQIWVANGNGSVSLLANTGVALSPSTGFTGAGLSTPGGIAVDLSGNVWVTNASDNSVTEILGAAAPVAPLSTAITNSTTGARP